MSAKHPRLNLDNSRSSGLLGTCIVAPHPYSLIMHMSKDSKATVRGRVYHSPYILRYCFSALLAPPLSKDHIGHICQLLVVA